MTLTKVCVRTANPVPTTVWISSFLHHDLWIDNDKIVGVSNCVISGIHSKPVPDRIAEKIKLLASKLVGHFPDVIVVYHNARLQLKKNMDLNCHLIYSRIKRRMISL